MQLHLVINEKGEVQGAKLTPGNVDDRTPVPELTKKLVGLLFGDKGYVKQELFEELYKRDLKLITGLKKNMNAGVVRHTKLRGRYVKRVAVCGGSGSFLLKDAINGGADVFVTADFKYHQ